MLTASQITLKAFDGHLFTPHGILAAFPIELGGKTIIVEVEVVNAPLDYNLLLGRSWFYPMASHLASWLQVLLHPITKHCSRSHAMKKRQYLPT
jgi:hypothetical protein